MALFSIDFSGIFDAIKRFLGPIGKLLDEIQKGYDKTVHIFDAADKLRESVVTELTAWKNFKQDIRFSQRVVNLETAIQKTRDLIEGIPASWHAILDIIKQVRENFRSATGTGGAAAAEEAVADVEEVEAGGITKLLAKFPRLARGLERTLGAVALIVQGLEQVVTVIDDLQTIVDEIRRIRLEFEKLDTIFLQQDNKRRTLRLSNGKKIRIRVGKLHG
jgi:methyl-accepting chemotaxis protein